tara:strand:+ start:203 stop:331 length:129 start_codon:yes stop_codon:yes gene_type:complete
MKVNSLSNSHDSGIIYAGDSLVSMGDSGIAGTNSSLGASGGE